MAMRGQSLRRPLAQAVPRALASLGPATAAWVLPNQHLPPGGAAGAVVSSHQRRPAAANSFAAASASAALLRTRFGASALTAATVQRAQGGSNAGIAASSGKAAEGVRSVGSVHRGKIVGNVVEAWERRTVDEVKGTRDPANFDDFQVYPPRAVPCLQRAAFLDTARRAADLFPFSLRSSSGWSTGRRLGSCALCQRVEYAEACHLFWHLHGAARRPGEPFHSPARI